MRRKKDLNDIGVEMSELVGDGDREINHGIADDLLQDLVWLLNERVLDACPDEKDDYYKTQGILDTYEEIDKWYA